MGKPSECRAGMRLAVWEAITVAAMFACTEAWLVPAIQVRLGAAVSWMGYLIWVPQVITVLFAANAGAMIPRWGGARNVAIATSFVQGGLLLLLAAPLALSPWASTPLGSGALPPWLNLPVLALGLAAAVGVCGAVTGIAWLSWMGDLVPERIRGRYIAYRNRWFMAVKLVAALIFSAMSWMHPYDPTVVGSGPWILVTIIVVGGMSRLGASVIMARQGLGRQRPLAAQRSLRTASVAALGPFSYLGSSRQHLIARWTVVWATFHFGWYIAVPFFGPFMQASVADGGLGLANQPWKYTTLMWLSMVVRIIFYPVAGALIARLGAASALRFALPALAVLPLAWATAAYGWLLVFEVLSGVAWSITECASAALVFGAHTHPAIRARLIGYHLMWCSVAMIAGAVLGQTVIATHVVPILVSGDPGYFRTVFLLSATFRLPGVILALWLLPRIPLLSPREWLIFLKELPGVDTADEISGMVLAMLRRRR